MTENELDYFHFESDRSSFEDLGMQNGFRYWFAKDLMKMLGYTDYAVFKRGPLNKAMTVCTTLDVDICTNFEQTTRDIDGVKQSDYRLSKVACYLVAMNGDVKKKEVAKAQAYFITVTEAFKRLREHKGIPDVRSPLDFMGREELAANLFRITQTEAKIRNEGIKGQIKLEEAAFSVGQQVRRSMENISGTRPENFLLEENGFQNIEAEIAHAFACRDRDNSRKDNVANHAKLNGYKAPYYQPSSRHLSFDNTD